MAETPYSGMKVGQYQITEKLWVGNFSETWRGKSIRGEEVIVQFIRHPQLISLLESYPLKPQKNTNDCIASLLAVYNQPCVLVWEAIEGRRLDIYIKNLGKIKESIALYIARKLLEILNGLASSGRIHGALRPTRVIITPTKKVMVCNYGLGQLEQLLVYQLCNEKKQDEIAAILPYFAPEVIEDEVFEDPKSDIYSVGMMLSEMLLGKLYPANEVLQVLRKKDYSSNIIQMVQKAITDFDERYTHPQEMYQDLNRLLTCSDQVEKIYVAPPRPTVNIAMEAIPADSEEYRVYQADVKSAQQTIEAEVVLAESAEMTPEEMLESQISYAKPTSSIKAMPPSLKQTARLDANQIMIATIDKKILDPLDKESLWPRSIIKYSIASIMGLIVLFFASAVLPAETSATSWIFAPAIAMNAMPQLFKALLTFIFASGFTALIFLPLYDFVGQLRFNILFKIVFSIFFFLLFILTIWGLCI